MKHQKLQLSIFLILAPMILSGQTDYFRTENSLYLDIKIMYENRAINAKSLKVLINGVQSSYTPDQVKEYGLRDGRVYKTFTVPEAGGDKRYFLERLVDGRLDIYYLKYESGNERYFIQVSDSSELREIPVTEEDARVFIEKYTADCKQAIDNLALLKLKPQSVKRYFRDYSSCKATPVPRFKYGLMLGLSNTIFIPTSEGKTYDLSSDNSFMLAAAASADIPLLPGNISIHPEIVIKSASIKYSFLLFDLPCELSLKNTSISLPILFRYNFFRKYLSPYIEAGPLLSVALKNKGALYQYHTTGTQTFDNLLQNNMAGFSAGAGLIYRYGSRYSWFAGIRYNSLFNLDENYLLNVRDLTVGAGILF